MKASGETGNKLGLFEWKLVGLYMKVMLDVGVVLLDVGDDGEKLSMVLGVLLNYLLCVVEDRVAGGASTSALTRVGLVVIEISIGDVLSGEFMDIM